MLNDCARVIGQHGATVVERDGKIVGVLVLIKIEIRVLLGNVAAQLEQQGNGLGRGLIQLIKVLGDERGST